MNSKPAFADKYDAFAAQWEEQLRSQFPDITWRLARYGDLETTSNIYTESEVTDTMPGMFVTGTSESGKQTNVVVPNTFLTNGVYSTDGITGTIFMIGERIRAELMS